MQTNSGGIMDSKDKLSDMFAMQAELNRRIGVDTTAVPAEQQPEWILNYCRALSQETAELIDSVPWKWWAKYQEYDKQNARVEIVDMFHFLISLAQVVGMSADDVHDIYMQKNKLNFKRQETGYAEKDESDNLDIG
jgi:dimeric dUTPase (all-alpha-NTP-PPase superfamily)